MSDSTVEFISIFTDVVEKSINSLDSPLASEPNIIRLGGDGLKFFKRFVALGSVAIRSKFEKYFFNLKKSATNY